MTRREKILQQLPFAVALEYQDTQYYITCRDIAFDGDEDEEPFFEPNVTVLYLYCENSGMWGEIDIYLDEMVDDPNLKLYTLKELSLES